MRYVVDRCLGEDLAEKLRGWGKDALFLDNDPRFTRTTPDEIWLPLMGEEGRIVLTGDHRIRRNYAEINALMENRVGAFLLPEDIKGDARIALVEPKMRKIENISNGRERPFIYILTKNGDLERRDTKKFLKTWREKRRRAGLPDIR